MISYSLITYLSLTFSYLIFVIRIYSAYIRDAFTKLSLNYNNGAMNFVIKYTARTSKMHPITKKRAHNDVN